MCCLIIVAPQGTNKDSEIMQKAIKNGFGSNKDGAGFAYLTSRGKYVHWRKGFFLEQTLTDAIKEEGLTEKDILFIHFRNGNVGEDAIFNCHPFPITSDNILLETCQGKTDVGVLMHNGTFYKYNSGYLNKKKSDTYEFIENFMYIPEFIALLKRDKALFEKHLDAYLGVNKIAYLFPDAGIRLVGNFLEDEGYFFSNDGYKDKTVVDRGGENYERNFFMGSADFNDDLEDKEWDYKNQCWIPLVKNTIKGLQPNRGFTEGNRHSAQFSRVRNTNKVSFIDVRLQVTEENFEELRFHCKKPISNSFKIGETYFISNFEKDHLSQLMYRSGMPNYQIVVPTKEILDIENFTVLPRIKPELVKKWSDYITLINYYGIQPSLSAYKKLEVKREKTLNKLDVNFQKQGLGRITRDALVMYMKDCTNPRVTRDKAREKKVLEVEELSFHPHEYD